ncbi:fibroblast growth factor-binding protein 1-like [Lampetra planeri]
MQSKHFAMLLLLGVCLQLCLVMVVKTDQNAQKHGHHLKKTPGQTRSGQALPLKANLPSMLKPSHRGRLRALDGAQCFWKVLSDAPEPTLTLQLRCRSAPSCTYRGSPVSCPAYERKHSYFWTQVVKALKQRDSACDVTAGQLIAPLCKKSPASWLGLVEELEAKVTTEATTTTTTTATSDVQMGARAADELGEAGEQVAEEEGEEECSDLWRSLCNFLEGAVPGK